MWEVFILDLVKIREMIRECKECNIAENSYFIATHTLIGDQLMVHWACHENLDYIKYYFLHNFIIHAMMLQNMFSKDEFIRLEFIKSFLREEKMEQTKNFYKRW